MRQRRSVQDGQNVRDASPRRRRFGKAERLRSRLAPGPQRRALEHRSGARPSRSPQSASRRLSLSSESRAPSRHPPLLAWPHLPRETRGSATETVALPIRRQILSAFVLTPVNSKISRSIFNVLCKFHVCPAFSAREDFPLVAARQPGLCPARNLNTDSSFSAEMPWAPSQSARVHPRSFAPDLPACG